MLTHALGEMNTSTTTRLYFG